MSNSAPLVSNAFQTFIKAAPQHAQAWGAHTQGLAALRLESGIPFHVQLI